MNEIDEIRERLQSQGMLPNTFVFLIGAVRGWYDKNDLPNQESGDSTLLAARSLESAIREINRSQAEK